MWTHFNDTRPKARKQYICSLCELPIPAETIHVARRGESEGEVATHRMHLDCEQMTQDNHWREEHWEQRDAHEFRQELEAWKKGKGGKDE